jgi:hypothetical protein
LPKFGNVAFIYFTYFSKCPEFQQIIKYSIMARILIHNDPVQSKVKRKCLNLGDWLSIRFEFNISGEIKDWATKRNQRNRLT